MRLAKKSLIILALMLIPLASQAGDCIDWPRLMTQYTLDSMPKGKVVVINPFTNYTKKSGDDWLKLGLPDLLASMLSASKDLTVLTGLAARYSPLSRNPQYIVEGMFQHLNGTLRIFIKLLNGPNRKLLKQNMITVSYPENKDFFWEMAKTTKQICEFIKVKYDDDKLEKIRDATISTQVYEFYSKGRQILDKYQVGETEVAKIWFEQAKRKDYRSWLGYEGLIDLYTFLGFYNKQRRASFGSYFEQAEKELVQMHRLAKQPPPIRQLSKRSTRKKKSRDEKLTNRFLLGQAAFTEGLIAAQNANWEKAAQAFEQSVKFVPEDAITWYQLSRIYEKMGMIPKTTNALHKAYEINPCIEK